MRLFLFALVGLLFIFSGGCRREKNPCDGLLPPKAEFGIKEQLSDTAFFADTVFRDNGVSFVSGRTYQSVVWKIGTDPREFTKPQFGLNFVNFLGTVDVHFTGRAAPNTQCFPLDSGVYRGVKKLTIVEQVEKPLLTLSPLLGRYRGAFTNSPSDTFTVRIEYFDSAKYDRSIMGSKNFYFISNFPKGYRDTTSESGRQYPELSYGDMPEMGYKCLQFGSGSSILSGQNFGELVADTLKIYHQHPLTGRKVFIGRRI